MKITVSTGFFLPVPACDLSAFAFFRMRGLAAVAYAIIYVSAVIIRALSSTIWPGMPCTLCTPAAFSPSGPEYDECCLQQRCMPPWKSNPSSPTFGGDPPCVPRRYCAALRVLSFRPHQNERQCSSVLCLPATSGCCGVLHESTIVQYDLRILFFAPSSTCDTAIHLSGAVPCRYGVCLQPSGRFEDDVVPFLKMIRYPFTLSRSSLAAVGAPQTWPKVRNAPIQRTCASCTSVS